RASYALKLLQSEGELTIASTGKDPDTGRLVTQEYRVEGPVMIFLTTTAIEVDEELLNRCIVLTVDEDREQTRAIHKLQRQRKTLEGLLANQDRDLIRKVHQNAQRLLRPLLVANPFAEKLTFLDDRTRTRRDHMKYLTLIQSIALLHQYQRPLRTVQHRGQSVNYIEVTPDDIEVANQLAHQVLGRSLDELPPQTRRLLNLLDEMVTAESQKLGLAKIDYRFTRRQVREFTSWSTTQVRVHLDRLEEQEYVQASNSGRGRSVVYELLYDGQGQSGEPFLTGLLDADRLRHDYDDKLTGSEAGLADQEAELTGPKRPQNAPKTAPKRGANNAKTLHVVARLARSGCDDDENALLGTEKTAPSYALARRRDISSSLAAKSC
ncbi:MAG: DNA primase, partial [Gammaproteobacteria bacterium]|nr:DNA primase [Gammaproteobacteria bacterium]